MCAEGVADARFPWKACSRRRLSKLQHFL